VLIADEVDFQLVGLTWNILQGREQGYDVGFSIPDEGSYGFVDSIGITPWAPNRCNALAYANACMTPETAGPLNSSLVGIGPTEEINAALDPEVRALFPEDIEKDFFGKMKWNISHLDPEGPYATLSEWETVWNDVKLGA
jgi:spermidine/putrescine-binding protein